MILLVSTSDDLRVTTDRTSTVDCHATWADRTTTTTLGRTNTLINAAANTFSVVGSPAASTYRTVKTLQMRNRGSGVVKITLVHRQSGPTDAELMSLMLGPGDALHYDEHDGFHLIRAGHIETAAVVGALTPTVGVMYSQTLLANQANAHATANRLFDVQSFGFPVVEDLRYWFKYNLMYTSASTGTGSRWCVYGPGGTTAIISRWTGSLTTTTITTAEGISGYDLPAAASVTSAATGANVAVLEGYIDRPTCNGFVFLRFASEVTVSAITLLKGSYLQWMRTV